MNILVIDVGGTHVKILATGQNDKREFDSGPIMTAQQMASGVRKLAGWSYDVVSIGYPGPVLHDRPVADPKNLGPGWMGFNFRKAFGRPVNATDLVRALAAYERTLVSFNSPFDHFIAGDSKAIDDAAKHGWELFNTKALCNKCHALSDKERDVTNFTDFDYHNIGIGILKHHVAESTHRAEQQLAEGTLEQVDRAAIESDLSVLGRFLVTKKPADIAAFKTPNLRNVLVTAPYFHDGSQATLWDVIDHYNKGDGLKDPWLDEDIQPLALTESEIDDLVEFLASLTSPQYRELGLRELARQRALSRVSRPQRDTSRAFGPKPPRPAAVPD